MSRTTATPDRSRRPRRARIAYGHSAARVGLIACLLGLALVASSWLWEGRWADAALSAGAALGAFVSVLAAYIERRQLGSWTPFALLLLALAIGEAFIFVS